MALEAKELQKLAALLGEALAPRIREAVAENVGVRMEALAQTMRAETKEALDAVQAATSKAIEDASATLRRDVSELALASEHAASAAATAYDAKLLAATGAIQESLKARDDALDGITKRLNEQATALQTTTAEHDEAIFKVQRMIPVLPEPQPPLTLVCGGDLSDEMREAMDLVVRQVLNPIIESSIGPVQQAITAQAEKLAGIDLQPVQARIDAVAASVEAKSAELDEALHNITTVAVEQADEFSKQVLETNQNLLLTVADARKELEAFASGKVEALAVQVEALGTTLRDEAKSSCEDVVRNLDLQVRLEALGHGVETQMDAIRKNVEDVTAAVASVRTDAEQAREASAAALNDTATTLRAELAEVIAESDALRVEAVTDLGKQLTTVTDLMAGLEKRLATEAEATEAIVTRMDVTADAREHADAALAARLDALDATVQANAASITVVDETVKAAGERIDALHAYATTGAAQREAELRDEMGRAISSNGEAIAELGKTLDALDATVKDNVARITILNVATVGAAEREKELRAEIEQAKARNSDGLTQAFDNIAVLRNALDAAQAANADRWKATDERIDAADETVAVRLDVVNARLDVAGGQAKKLADDLELYSAFSAQTGQKVDANIISIDELRAQHAESVAMHDETREQARQLVRTNLDAAQQALLQEIGALDEELKTLRSALDAATASTASELTEVRALHAAANDEMKVAISVGADSVRKALTERLDAMDGTVKQLATAVEVAHDGIRKTNEDLLAEADHVQVALKALDRGVSTAMERSGALEDNLANLKSDFSAARATLDEEVKVVAGKLAQVGDAAKAANDELEKQIATVHRQSTDMGMEAAGFYKRIESTEAHVLELAQADKSMQEELQAAVESYDTHVEAMSKQLIESDAEITGRFSSLETATAEVGKRIDAVSTRIDTVSEQADAGLVEMRKALAVTANDLRAAVSTDLGAVKEELTELTRQVGSAVEEKVGTVKTDMETLSKAMHEAQADVNEATRDAIAATTVQVSALSQAVKDATAVVPELVLAEVVKVEASMLQSAKDAAFATAVEVYGNAKPEIDSIARAAALDAVPAAVQAATAGLPDALRGPLVLAATEAATQVADRAEKAASEAIRAASEAAIATARAEAGEIATVRAAAAAEGLRESLLATLDPTERVEHAVAATVPAVVRDVVAEVAATSESKLYLQLAEKVQKEIDRLPRPRDGKDGEHGKDGRIKSPEPHVLGKRYAADEWVFHSNGVWVSARSTDAEPAADSADWDCITPGIKALEATLAEDGRTIELHFELSNGQFQKCDVRLPIPVVRDIYDPEYKYAVQDITVYDGSWWKALKDGLLPRPGTDATAWKLSIKHGKDGKDLKQPPPAVIRSMGEWVPDLLYPANVVVEHAGVHWLSLRSTRERPPWVVLKSNDTWLKLGA